MASAIMCENEVLEMEAVDWVRGNDTALVARLLPLVREQSVLFDFSKVERIDAAGLAALITLYCEARQSGRSLAISNPTPHVSEILAVVGLDRILLAYSEERRPLLEQRLVRSAA